MLLIVAVLQTSVMPSIALSGVIPDLMLLVVVSWSLLRGSRASLLWALGGGLLLDLLSGGPFGAATLSLTLSSLVTGLGEFNVFRDSLWLPLVASILATVAYDLAYVVILQVSGRSLPLVASLPQVIIPGMILNALVMYPTYGAMRWLHQRVG